MWIQQSFDQTQKNTQARKDISQFEEELWPTHTHRLSLLWTNIDETLYEESYSGKAHGRGK